MTLPNPEEAAPSEPVTPTISTERPRPGVDESARPWKLMRDDRSPLSRDLLAELPFGHRLRVQVRGESMGPRWRGPVQVERCRPDEVGLGDVVLFEDPRGGLTLHRVLWRRAGGRLVTKGDGLRYTDPGWGSDRVLARVTAESEIAPRRWARWLRSTVAVVPGRLAARIRPLVPRRPAVRS